MTTGQNTGKTGAFVGREREMVLLAGRYEVALSGRTSVVLVSGDPGLGKSYLLDRFATAAEAAGARILRGGASDAEGMPPYLPFLEALGQHVRSASVDELRRQLGPWAASLAQIVPELTLKLGELPVSYPLPAEQARLRLYEAVGAFLSAVASSTPVVLLFDDLQWADGASLDLLRHVVRHQSSARLLVLGACREGDEAESPALQSALVELNRLRTLTRLTLDPLSEQEVGALAANYLGAPVHPDTVSLLWRRSEGNPFFAEELLRDWIDTASLVQEKGRWFRESGEEHHLPTTIVSAIQHRLARLPVDSADCLRTAAVAGRRFDVEFLASVVGQDAEALEKQLLEIARTRLITSEPDGTYAFRHDTVRQVLYAEVSPIRRRRLHGFIGHALETKSGEDGRHLADLAFHFSRSGDRHRGSAYSLKAAEEALAAHAPSEAFSCFRVALDQMDPESPDRGEVMLGMGKAATLAGMEKEAVSVYGAAQDYFRQRGDREALAVVGHHLGHAWWRQEEISRARSAFETALVLLEDHPGPAQVQLLVDLASLVGVSQHQYDSATEYARRALGSARGLTDEWLLASATRTLGNLLVRGNNLAEGIPLLEEALRLEVAADDPVEAHECCANLTIAYFWRGAIRRSRETAEQRLALARRCHDPYQLRHAYTWLAVVDAIHGRWSGAENHLVDAESVIERLSSSEPRAYLSFVHGTVSYFRGEYGAAEAYLEEAVRLFRELGPGALIWYLGWLSLARATLGKEVEARATMDELEALLAALPEGTMPTGEPLAQLTMTSLALGDRERAVRYYPRLAVFEGQFQDFLVDRLLGEVARLQGDWQKARAYLDAAEATARREWMPCELALALKAQAGLALSAGARSGETRVRVLLEEARKLFEQLGNQSEAERVDDWLHGITRPNRRPSLPAGLTEREVEVLRLVAAGKSNREIAVELVLSERTVEHHLAHIYTKIGVENRAAAAAFSIREGLG